MGRIRTIKPELPKDELLGKLSRDVRLLFVLLFTLVDDDGRFRASAALIRAELFPYDEDLSQHDVAEWLRALEESGRIVCYAVNGQRYGQMVNFRRHQRIEKPSPSKIPPPADDSETPPGILPESSPTIPGGIGREGKGMEGNGSTRARAGGILPHDPDPPASPGALAIIGPALEGLLGRTVADGELRHIREHLRIGYSPQQLADAFRNISAAKPRPRAAFPAALSLVRSVKPGEAVPKWADSFEKPKPVAPDPKRCVVCKKQPAMPGKDRCVNHLYDETGEALGDE